MVESARAGVRVLLTLGILAGCDGPRSTPAAATMGPGGVPARSQTSVPARARTVHAPDGMPPGSAGPPVSGGTENATPAVAGARP